MINDTWSYISDEVQKTYVEIVYMKCRMCSVIFYNYLYVKIWQDVSQKHLSGYKWGQNGVDDDDESWRLSHDIFMTLVRSALTLTHMLADRRELKMTENNTLEIKFTVKWTLIL